MCYLDAEEIAATLRQPNRSSLEGQRDHVLLAFLYNTWGANPRSAGCLSAGHPVRITRSGRVAW
jgi:hypothetical protein